VCVRWEKGTEKGSRVRKREILENTREREREREKKRLKPLDWDAGTRGDGLGRAAVASAAAE